MSRFQEHPYALEHRSMCPAAAKRRYGPMRCQHSPPGRGSSYLLFANATHKKGNAFAFTDNIVPLGTYELRAENPSLGSSSLTLLDGHCCGWVLSRNILINPHGNPPSTYPAGQYWVSSLAAVGFQDLSRETSR